MKPQARQGDLEVTRDGLKPITQCNSRRTYVDNLRAAAVGDRLVNFTATTGSGRVYIEGRRAHRKMDRNSGGGVCIQGSDTVFVQ
jgi:uncharacterized Zn-binding protein involved in type VI secretion